MAQTCRHTTTHSQPATVSVVIDVQAGFEDSEHTSEIYSKPKGATLQLSSSNALPLTWCDCSYMTSCMSQAGAWRPG